MSPERPGPTYPDPLRREESSQFTTEDGPSCPSTVDDRHDRESEPGSSGAEVEIISDLETYSNAALLLGFSAGNDPDNQLCYWYSGVITPRQREYLEQMEPVFNRLLSMYPGLSRLTTRVGMMPFELARNVAENDLNEVIEALRMIYSWRYLPDEPEREPDSLSIIEHIEYNILPRLKEHFRHQSAQPYQRYLETNHWKRKRLQALRKAEHRCNLCSSTQSLEVHHNRYDNLWCEPMEDLIVLCRSCHTKHHGSSPDYRAQAF